MFRRRSFPSGSSSHSFPTIKDFNLCSDLAGLLRLLLMPARPFTLYVLPMLGLFFIAVVFLPGIFHAPTPGPSFSSTSFPTAVAAGEDSGVGDEGFTDVVAAFRKWDQRVGCSNFRERNREWGRNGSAALQGEGGGECGELKMEHVSVLVKKWTWIPDNLDGLYSCRCGLSCLWTKSGVLADRPDALLFETLIPPIIRQRGDPLRVYMDLEAGRKRSGFEDIFVSYHADDDVQATYAGALFHNNRNYYVSQNKTNDVLVYWSSSRCLPERNKLAKKFLSQLTYHSFGKCMNNVGGLDMALVLYPECAVDDKRKPNWWDHLHCAMSHYKFVLAIENTRTESYVTEKLFYALDAGAVPIYFGAPNVLDLVPPNSIIDGSKFSSLDELAAYVKSLANDPVAYAEYHAWRRCGVMGNYARVRATSLDTLPCRLCEFVSRKWGRNT